MRQFASSNQIQIMVINIQSFQKDVADKELSEMTEDELKKLNVINRENDRMSGRRPIEFIQAANPIVIIDEPQSVDTTEKSRRAISNLNPLATTVAAFVLGAAGASAGNLPQYEFAGFPMSPHQISVLGSGGIQEQSPIPTLTLDGMPASPHQIAVIGPRTKKQIVEKLNKDASGISSQTTN